MTETAQPSVAAESEVASDPFQDAADAFKVSLGQAEAPKRDASGRFAAAEAAEEIEAGAEAEEAEAQAENDAQADEADEAAEEAQPDAVDLPASWAKEDAEIWSALPPEAQAKIAEREGQRESALNLKFQELANERKALEPERASLAEGRTKFIQAADDVLMLVAPQRPTPQQYGAGTGRYDREGYDLAVAQYENDTGILAQLREQRDRAAQEQQEAQEKAQTEAHGAIEAQWRPKLVELVPDLASDDKRGAAVRSIVEYAVSSGIPQEVFTDPALAGRVTSPELIMAWKAMQYDRQQAARKDVKPLAAKAPSPTVRSGASPTRSAIQHQQRQKDFARLREEGSVEAGAAIFKHFLKG